MTDIPPKVHATTGYLLVIDDHPLFARGIAEFLQQRCHFTATQIASDTKEALESVKKLGNPSLIVMDFWLAQGASLELLKQLQLMCPDTKTLIVSADADSRVSKQVQVLGAHGFLLKHQTPDTFADVVMKILDGEKWFENENYQQNTQHQLPISLAELGLTLRQGEVLQLVLKGFSNKQIAKKINVGEQTVKEHVSIILERLNVKNRVAVITLLQGRMINL